MTQKPCAGRLLALIIPLVFVGRPLTAMDAPAFDPDVDNIDSLLKTMTWLPKSNLQPPVIDVTAFKVIDVPVDPAWQTADAFWQPGVPSQKGYITEVMVREGNLQPRPVKKRVGHWIEYDRDGRVLFEGSWNAHSAMIGPHFFYFDPTQTPGLRVPRGDPLPLHKIEVYGARALDANQPSLMELAKDAPMSEQVWFYPTGELDSVTTYEAGQGTSATSHDGLHQMKWHPPVLASRQQRQPDLLASPFAQAVQEQRPQSAPTGPQLAEFAIQTSGDNAERKTVRYNTNGQPLEILNQVLGSSAVTDPRNWKFSWVSPDGMLDVVRVANKEWGSLGRPTDLPITAVRRIVKWKTPGKMEDGLLALGFAAQAPDKTWVAAGPWVIWDDQGSPLGAGAFRNGKQQADWVEYRYLDITGKHTLIETDRGVYQNGARNLIWKIDLRPGNPDLAGVKESRRNMQEGYVRQVTYANGKVITTEDNFK